MSIVKCKCTNAFQDRRYGNGMRVTTPTLKGDQQSHDARCTVCGAVHRVPGAPPRSGKKAK